VTIWRSTVATLAAGISVASVVATAAQKPAPAAAPPIALRVTCEGVEQPTSKLQVHVMNSSSRETAIRLGFTPGAQTHVVDAINIIAIRPATGADEDFLYVNPKYAAFTGTRAPWIVPLAAGASYDVELPVKDFISRMNYVPLDPAVAGGARLVLDARAAAKQPGRAWIGTVDAVIEPCV
jgi:hypothetical protein